MSATENQAPQDNPAPAAGNPAPTFALTPGQALRSEVIDYTNPTGVKLYRGATAPLYKNDGDLFGCNAGGLKDFIDLLRDRSNEYGWTTILEIPDDPTDLVEGNTTSLLEHHGVIPLSRVQAHADKYIDQNCRAAQDSMQMYLCLMKSITKEGRQKISIWRESYERIGIASGPCLLKVIIRESHIDTHATTSHIRTQLVSLDVYMAQVGSDIEKFNIHVRNLIEQLYARGKTTHDLLTNLFRGYKAAKDKRFVDYIETKEEKYEEGESLEAETLMNHAHNKYKILKLRNMWAATSPDEEKILALEAKIEKMEKSRVKSKTDKEKAKGRKTRDKPAWMLVEPENKSVTKVVDGKEYWWCPNHKCFTRHKPEDCKGKGFKPSSTNDEKNDEDDRKLKLSSALEAVHEEYSDEE